MIAENLHVDPIGQEGRGLFSVEIGFKVGFVLCLNPVDFVIQDRDFDLFQTLKLSFQVLFERYNLVFGQPIIGEASKVAQFPDRE